MKISSSFAKNREPFGSVNRRLFSGRNSSSGSIGKLTLVVLALGAVGAAFFFYGQPRLNAVVADKSPAALETLPPAPAPAQPDDTPDSTEVADAPVAAAPSSTPAPAAPEPTVAKRSTPKTAPAGMVYLARRMTITRETGITSLPAGTLVIVKSQDGEKIQASIRGMTLELGGGDYVTVYEGAD